MATAAGQVSERVSCSLTLLSELLRIVKIPEVSGVLSVSLNSSSCCLLCDHIHRHHQLHHGTRTFSAKPTIADRQALATTFATPWVSLRTPGLSRSACSISRYLLESHRASATMWWNRASSTSPLVRRGVGQNTKIKGPNRADGTSKAAMRNLRIRQSQSRSQVGREEPQQALVRDRRHRLRRAPKVKARMRLQRKQAAMPKTKTLAKKRTSPPPSYPGRRGLAGQKHARFISRQCCSRSTTRRSP